MRPTDHVWYVAYGSNLARRRFLAYVLGGRVDGPDREYPGCRDRTPPTAHRRIHLPHRLGFARRSPRWQGGGVAFVDVGHDARVRTVGRAWRLRAAQLADLVAQENGGAQSEVDPGWVGLAPGESVEIAGSGWYDRVLACDPIDGEPAFTVTGSAWAGSPNPPVPSYLDTMREGLAELGLDAPSIEDYLRDCQG